MRTFNVGDKAPIIVPVTFTVASDAGFMGTSVTNVLLRIVRANDTTLDVNLVPTATTATLVTCAWSLSALGTDFPVAGTYYAAAWLYNGAVLLGWTADLPFVVATRKVPAP